MSTSRRVRIARACYGALLRLAPPGTRRDYETEMRATFDALSAAADARGLWALMRLLVREATDLLRARRSSNTPALDVERKSAMSSWMEFFAPMAQPLQLVRTLTRRPLFTLAVMG